MTTTTPRRRSPSTPAASQATLGPCWLCGRDVTAATPQLWIHVVQDGTDMLAVSDDEARTILAHGGIDRGRHPLDLACCERLGLAPYALAFCSEDANV